MFLSDADFSKYSQRNDVLKIHNNDNDYRSNPSDSRTKPVIIFWTTYLFQDDPAPHEHSQGGYFSLIQKYNDVALKRLSTGS
jgi:hypothetical protein